MVKSSITLGFAGFAFHFSLTKWLKRYVIAWAKQRADVNDVYAHILTIKHQNFK